MGPVIATEFEDSATRARMYSNLYRNTHSAATATHLTAVTASKNSPLMARCPRLLSPSTCREQSLERHPSRSPTRTPLASSANKKFSNNQPTTKCLFSRSSETYNLVKTVAQLSIIESNRNILHRMPYTDGIPIPPNGQTRICRESPKAESGTLPSPTCESRVVDSIPSSITCDELGERLMSGEQCPMLLDCRSFLAFNICHINGAINVGCLDRLTKRRLQQGKMQFADLIKCHMTKQKFIVCEGVEIVVYDDQTQQYEEENSNMTPLVAVIQLLLKAGKKPYFLKGGLKEFHAKYEKFCVVSQSLPDAPLYSPTTPIVSDQIDKAVASKILPFMFLGNERDIANLELLRELGITHILNVTSNVQIHFEDQGIEYRRLPASDSGHQNLKQYFDEASEFIENVRQSGGKVLIHCQAGVSRSSTIVIAYLMCHSQLTMHQTYQFVKSKRSIIAPNFNFMGQLMELEQFLQEGKVERHVCPELEEELEAQPSLIEEK